MESNILCPEMLELLVGAVGGLVVGGDGLLEVLVLGIGLCECLVELGVLILDCL